MFNPIEYKIRVLTHVAKEMTESDFLEILWRMIVLNVIDQDEYNRIWHYAIQVF